MAFLDLVKTVLTPMQYVVFEWTGTTPNPQSYLVTATSISPAHVVTSTVAGSITRARLGQLRWGATYTLTIVAQYANPAQNVTAEYDPLLVDIQSAHAQRLRQAVWDILFDANLTHLSRNVTMLHDGMYRPAEWPENKTQGAKMPLIEVCDPDLDDSAFATQARAVDVYRVPLKLWDNGDPSDADTTAALWQLLELVRKAIDNKPNLHLNQCGVKHLSWSWQKKKGRMKGRDRATGFALDLVVPIQRSLS